MKDFDLQQNLWRPFTIHSLNRNCFKSGSHLRTDRIGLSTVSSVMYEKHFHEDAMSRGLQRVNPIPTKRGPHCGKRQLNEPNIELWEKPL